MSDPKLAQKLQKARLDLLNAEKDYLIGHGWTHITVNSVFLWHRIMPDGEVVTAPTATAILIQAYES